MGLDIKLGRSVQRVSESIIQIYDIGLLNCDLLMKNGDIVRAPSSSLLTTPIVILKMKNSRESNKLPAGVS